VFTPYPTWESVLSTSWLCHNGARLTACVAVCGQGLLRYGQHELAIAMLCVGLAACSSRQDV
jgi:hypothetical protein